MKKNYIAPEADVLCFRPLENLAAENLLEGEAGNVGGAVRDPKSDILIEF